MGNCQAAEAATVVIQHPGGGKVERMYWSLSASQVMASNPGHYVAVIVTSTTSSGAGAAPVRHLKLLRPDDTLHIGHVYRLVSFEEVLKEFASKKHVKLSKLLVAQRERRSNTDHRERRERERGGGGRERVGKSNRAANTPVVVVESQVEEGEVEGMGSSSSSGIGRSGGAVSRHGQWRPALQSIAEVGS